MKQPVITPSAQRKLIHQTTTLKAYKTFHKLFFRDGGMWLKRVEEDIQNPEFGPVNEDYFRFLTLCGILVSQYGFPFLEGQLQRHEKGEWKYSPVSVRHQLAVAVFMAKLNQQSYVVKEKYIEVLADDSLANGVWGIHLPLYEGKMAPYTVIKEIRQKAEERIAEQTRAISLPDKELNEQLAALQFTSHDAETMSVGEMREKIAPSLKQISKNLITVDNILVDEY